MLANKSKSGAGRLILTDGAHVMLANFRDERASVATHLNCASASPVEVALLHDHLRREFLVKRDDFVRERCGGDYIWPKDEPFTPYDLPKPPALPRWLDWLVNASVAALLGLIGFGVYWLVLR
jgi:hypothetical protein